MTAPRVDEIPDATRPGHWILPHWDGHGIRAGLTDALHDMHVRDRPPAEVTAAFDGLRRAVPGMSTVVVAPQVHGCDVLLTPDGSASVRVSDAADGHVSGTPGQLLAVTVADCVPIYLHDPATGWVALLHAGWRGTAAGILSGAITQLEALGARRDTVLMHCGVSICADCYEVGPEVHAAMGGPPPPGPAPLDLRETLARQAVALGVGSVTVSGLCAREHPSFHSHRATGGAPGRMAAYLGRTTA